MKLNEIQDLIKFVAKSGVSEVELETKDVKIVIKTPAGKKEQVFVQATPAVQPVIQMSAPAVQQAAPPFVNVGDEIAAGKPVCIIEAMKLFNEIESDVKGKIVKVLVNDATPVEYYQPLFLIEPTA